MLKAYQYNFSSDIYAANDVVGAKILWDGTIGENKPIKEGYLRELSNSELETLFPVIDENGREIEGQEISVREMLENYGETPGWLCAYNPKIGMRIQIILRIFPNADIVDQQRVIEVNGLKKNSQPQNCEIVAMKEMGLPSVSSRRFYLVECENYGIHLRICTAYPNCGYDEFAVVHHMKNVHDVDYPSWKEYFKESIT